MTREEAIEKLKWLLECSYVDSFEDAENKALEMAIKALEQEPCSDAVSRQAVFKEINCWIGSGEYRYAMAEHFLIDRIKTMPPVNPQEPKTGHWYIDERPESNREVICSNCDQPIFKYHRLDFDYRPKYCPNCGCRMVESQKVKGG